MEKLKNNLNIPKLFTKKLTSIPFILLTGDKKYNKRTE